MKTEENVRIPLRLHNLSRFPRAGFPLLYLLLFFTLSQKKAARKPPFSCVQTDECATMAAGVLR